MAALSTLAAIGVGAVGGAILNKIGGGKKPSGTLLTPTAPPPVDTDMLTRDAATRMTALATQAEKRTAGLGGKRSTILTDQQNLGAAPTTKSTLLGV